MRSFVFTVDDNIRFLKEITEKNSDSIFSHPYLSMLRRLNERFGVKIQLNLFYESNGFDLLQMSDRYIKEWQGISNWLKLSFHSKKENEFPYQDSGYKEVYDDCNAVNTEILRFAGEASLASTTTIHYCQLTDAGIKAMADNGVKGLLGLFGTNEHPMVSYNLSESDAENVRNGAIISIGSISYAPIDMIVNSVRIEKIEDLLNELTLRDSIRVMIHEQYFYKDYPFYQPDFEKKLETVFNILSNHGYKSYFFEELI